MRRVLPLLLLAGVAVAAPSGFTRLTGREAARQDPIRSLDVAFLAWSEGEGTMLVRAGDGVALHDAGGREIRRLPCAAAGADDPPVEGALSPDGTRAVVRLASGRACAWDTGSVLPLLVSGGRSWRTVAITDTALAVGHEDGAVEVRELVTGARRWRRGYGNGAVVDLRFDADGERLVAAFAKRGAAVLDPRSGRLIRAVGATPTTAVDLDPTRPRLAVGLPTGAVDIYDTETWRLAETLEVGTAPVADLDYRKAGDQLLVATRARDDGALVAWSFDEGGEILREPPRGDRPVAAARFNPYGDELVATDGVGRSAMWRQPTRSQMPVLIAPYEPPLHRGLPPRVPLDPAPLPPTVALGDVRSLAPDGSRAVVRVVPAPPPRPDDPLAPAARAATPAAAPAGPPPLQMVAADGGQGPVLAESGAVEGPLAWDGGRLAAWSTDGWLRVWDTATGAVVGKIAADRPAGLGYRRGRLVAVDPGGTVRYAGGGAALPVVPDLAEVTVAEVDPERPDRLVVGTRDGGVRPHETRRPNRGRGAILHAGPVLALALSADGRYVASASARLGDAGGLVAVQRIDNPEGEAVVTARLETVPEALTFSVDGRWLLARAARGAQVVDARTGALHLDLMAPLRGAAWTADGGVRVVDEVGRTWVVRPAAAPLREHQAGRVVARTTWGTRVATLDGDQVTLWDGSTGRRRRVLLPAGQAVEAARFDRSGRLLALRHADGTVESHYWEADTAQVVPAPAPGAPGWFAYAPDGSALWSFAAPRTLRAVDPASGAERERVELPAGRGAVRVEEAPGAPRFVRLVDDAGEVGWLDLGPDSIGLVDAATQGRPLAVRPDGRVLATVDPRTGGVRRRALGTGLADSPAIPLVEGRPVVLAGWDPDGALLMVLDAGGLLRLADDFGVVGRIQTDAPRAYGLPWGRPAHLSVDRGGRVTLIDEAGRTRSWNWASGNEAGPPAEGAGAVLPVAPARARALTADGRTLFLGGADGVVRAVDLVTGAQVGLGHAHREAITAVAVDPEGRVLATGGGEGAVYGWDLTTWTPVLPASTFGDPPAHLAVGPDGHWIAGLGPQGVLRVWDVSTRKPWARWQLAPALLDGVRGLSFLANTRLVVDGATTRWLDLWSGEDGAVGAAPAVAGPRWAPGAPAASLRAPMVDAFALPDGRTEVVLGADGRVHVWDVEGPTLRSVTTLYGDGSWIVDRADGVRLASRTLRDGSDSPINRVPRFEE